jgi:hypothetical protein
MYVRYPGFKFKDCNGGLPVVFMTIKTKTFEGNTAEVFDMPTGCTSTGSHAASNLPSWYAQHIVNWMKLILEPAWTQCRL